MRRDLVATLLLVALLFAFPLHVLQSSNSGRNSHDTNRAPVVTDGGLPATRQARGAPAICADDKRSIPRIVHQSWKEKRPPPPLEPLSARWRSLSGWEYRLWTDEDNERLWKEHAPELIDVFSAYNDTPHTVRNGHEVGASVREGYEIQRPTGIRRADASRLLYMHVHGGVYADLDVIPCGDSIDGLLHKPLVLVSLTPGPATPSRVRLRGASPTTPLLSGERARAEQAVEAHAVRDQLLHGVSAAPPLLEARPRPLAPPRAPQGRDERGGALLSQRGVGVVLEEADAALRGVDPIRGRAAPLPRAAGGVRRPLLGGHVARPKPCHRNAARARHNHLRPHAATVARRQPQRELRRRRARPPLR
mmetsp:Transcript_21448/g.68289  ORF Transcript_21448/g.68289 Transcript_21448/m.68289 type:complete len:363 (+) Transcript_21448:138-1226(+)